MGGESALPDIAELEDSGPPFEPKRPSGGGGTGQMTILPGQSREGYSDG